MNFIIGNGKGNTSASTAGAILGLTGIWGCCWMWTARSGRAMLLTLPLPMGEQDQLQKKKPNKIPPQISPEANLQNVPHILPMLQQAACQRSWGVSPPCPQGLQRTLRMLGRPADPYLHFYCSPMHIPPPLGPVFPKSSAHSGSSGEGHGEEGSGSGWAVGTGGSGVM